jgi:nucleoid-associated protein YgaU
VGIFGKKEEEKPKADFSDVRSGGSSSAQTPLQRQQEEHAAPQGGRSYTVRSGDSLSKIAKEVYGDASKWRAIYEANRDTITNPDLIHPGDVLQLPTA